MGHYGMSITVPGGYDEVKERVVAALKEQGFGVLTTIDVRDTMKQKLDVDMERYEILGACNPSLAHRALDTDREIGLLLPCNVVLREASEGIQVSALDPEEMFSLVDGMTAGELAELPTEAKAKLRAALDAVQAAPAA
ncbi:MAG TPA: DUF302 domain-containing protein [Trueperaceae bacterium]|nr:DUF302 domain-containing protein [Trueperaceae bacterium]